jgi:N-acetylglucosamine-6-phosphate deacetylase
LSTHLGNGSHRTLPKHGNLLFEQMAADELIASLIVDGHHLPESTVKVMVRAKSPERIILVTDAVAPAGSPPGRYKLAGLDVELDETGRVSKVGEKQYLAGSSVSMDRAIGLAVKWTGLPLDEVVAMASSRPAALVGKTPAGTVHADWDAESCTLTVERVQGDA